MEFSAVDICGKDAYQITPKKKIEIDLHSLKNKLKGFEVKYCDSILMILKYEDKAITVFPNGRMTIKNIKSKKDVIKIASEILSYV